MQWWPNKHIEGVSGSAFAGVSSHESDCIAWWLRSGLEFDAANKNSYAIIFSCLT